MLINSEEVKNTKLYGNLYDILNQIKKIQATTLDQLINDGLDDNGVAALTYNKKSLIDNVKREWYVESKSAEDPDKRVRCGLCNTPNKYLFYIRNRLNSYQVNVGSYCMTKFPEIEGYASHKYQLGQIQRSQLETSRRIKFHKQFPTATDIIDSANFYFDNLPILLPYEIYFPLKDVVFQLHVIYTKYIKYGKTPISTSKNSFELFDENINKYNQLKKVADDFITKNINETFICKQSEIEWMSQNKKTDLIETISKNNGFYSMQTLGEITSIDFIIKNFDMFSKCNTHKYISLICPKDIHAPLRFTIKSEGYDFLYDINIKKFMSQIGSRCFFESEFKFEEKDLFNVSKIMITNQNAINAADIVKNSCGIRGCALLVDEDTNYLYLYYKPDRSIKEFSPTDFLKLYDYRKIRKHANKMKFLDVLLTNGKWVSVKEQEMNGIDEKISKLYYHQYIDIWILWSPNSDYEIIGQVLGVIEDNKFVEVR